jgi:4-diphosphocytidyl-2-C-methyl-D-erythritol kinase
MPTSIRSYAKINIGLLIGPPDVRGDGFHELRTIYQTIALHDTVSVKVSKGQTGIEIKCKDRRVPQDETNTCWRVAERVMRALKVRAKVTISIEKKLPVQGGMGAASSNAIATMRALEKELKRQLDPHNRLRIAEEVGSDLPLFLIGGTVLGIGRGEQVLPLPDLPELNLVAATPGVGVSTPAAFKAWDGLFASGDLVVGSSGDQAGGTPDGQAAGRRRYDDNSLTVQEQTAKLNTFSHAVYSWLWSTSVVSGVSARGGNRAEAPLLDLVRTGIENDFERVVFPHYPAIRDVKRALEHAGSSYASLSGSGSTVYGIFRNAAAAKKAAKALQRQGIEAVATRTIGRKEFWK